MTKSKIRPLGDRILVKRVDNAEKTASGLYIPDSAQEKPQQGKVISVGKGRCKENGTILPVDLKAGDTIIFGKYSGHEVKVDSEDFIIMREEDVYGVLEA